MTNNTETEKLSWTKVAWGAVVWLALAITFLVIGGYLIMVLWNNIAMDVGAPELSFNAALNASLLVFVIGRIASALRLK